MTLSKPVKILIGLVTVWVTLYPLLFFAVCLAMFFGMSFVPPSSAASGDDFPLFLAPFFAIFPLHCLTIVLQMALSVFYLVHVIKNTVASDTVRIILGVGVFFMPFIAMPAYYYLCIWLDEPPEWARRAG